MGARRTCGPPPALCLSPPPHPSPRGGGSYSGLPGSVGDNLQRCDPVPAGPLCLVEALVGAGEDVGGEAVGRTEFADAAADGGGVAKGLAKNEGDLLAQVIGQGQCLGLPGAGHDDDEFVAAEAGDDIVLAQVLAAEASESRIWAGIHYRFDVEAGRAVGEKVAAKSLARAFMTHEQ